jgi:two-component system, OmpR family, sensor histidine kinase BaeS
MSLFSRFVLAFVLVALFAVGVSGWLGEFSTRTNLQRFAVERGWIKPLAKEFQLPTEADSTPDLGQPGKPNPEAAAPPLRGQLPPLAMARVLLNLRISQIISTSIALLVAAGIGAFLAFRLLRPIRELTAINQRYRLGERDARFQARGRDEINRLGETFNGLADQLGIEQRRQKQLVADIAHELRTPLTVLKGELEYLQDGLSQPTPQTLHRLAEEVDLLSRLVADLRLVSLADTDGLRLERCNLNLTELTREVMTAFERQAQTVGKHLQFEAESVRLELDPERIRQVLYNLLDNALRHTPEGGTVRCAIRKAEQQILLEISDEGPGIPPADLERVFERLYRTDTARNREAGGSGLGLAIVRTLVEAHGGKVWATSRPEGGAAFTVSLPQTSPTS